MSSKKNSCRGNYMRKYDMLCHMTPTPQTPHKGLSTHLLSPLLVHVIIEGSLTSKKVGDFSNFVAFLEYLKFIKVVE